MSHSNNSSKSPFDINAIRKWAAVHLPQVKYGWPTDEDRRKLPHVITLPGFSDRRRDFYHAFNRLRQKIEELCGADYIIEPMRHPGPGDEIIGYIVRLPCAATRAALVAWLP